MMQAHGSPSRRKVRVLLVDDSAVMRRLLRMVLDPQPFIEIAGTASSGPEALTAFESLQPDLVLLDIEMPGMNGLEVLSSIRSRNRRVAVIMCSTLTSRGARITIEALARGATDYVCKPGAQSDVREGVQTLTRDLLPKILALFPFEPLPAPQPAAAVAEPRPAVPSTQSLPPKLIAIGVSTGGPAALELLLPKFPAGFPLPILIVQHMPRLFTGLLAERLNALCALRVREADSSNRPEPGVIDIARGDWHLELTRDFRLGLNQNEPENFCRPSVDVLFRSAALTCSGHVLGVILTGMGSDGLAGCRAIRSAGGAVIAQDHATSVIWGMPGAVAHAGLANKVLALEAIPAEILRCIATSARATRTEAIAL